MKLGRPLVTLAAAAVVAATVAGLAQAGSPARLLTKFQPVLIFHPGEEFRPTTVESFVADSSLEAATGPTTWSVVDPARRPTPCRRRARPSGG